MCSIGDKLYIHIQADIPNSHTRELEYSPELFGRTIRENRHTTEGVCFYPLVPLSLSSIPVQERRKYFMDPSLFQSLIRGGKRKAKNLQDAVKKDYINHNIRATLDGLFPPQSVVFLQNQPYTVLDYQWTPGDWKMEVKSGPAPARTRAHPSVPKNSLYESMPDHLLMGDNYFEPTPKHPMLATTPCPFYVIHIQLDLFPGTKLPAEVIQGMPCRRKWNSVRRAWTNIMKRKRTRRRRTH